MKTILTCFTLLAVIGGASAAETTSAALSTSSSAKRIIEKVPPLGWGTNRETTFAGALSSALAVTKQPYDYATLMGMTALSFRTRWYRGDDGTLGDGSGPIGEGEEEFAAARKATGWQLAAPEVRREDPKSKDDIVQKIVNAVNTGQPVLGYGPDNPDMAVIFGYEDGGKILLAYDYYQNNATVKIPAPKLDPFVMILGERSEPLSQRDALIESLKRAVKNWNRGVISQGKGRYFYGDDAYTRWIDDLFKVDGLSEEGKKHTFHASWWSMDSLTDARATAVTYLKGNTSLLNKDGQAALERAADMYQQEGQLLNATFINKDVFLGPWTGKSISDWTPEVRKRERTLLGKARRLEIGAIAEIEKALAAEGVEVKPLKVRTLDR